MHTIMYIFVSFQYSPQYAGCHLDVEFLSVSRTVAQSRSQLLFPLSLLVLRIQRTDDVDMPFA